MQNDRNALKAGLFMVFTFLAIVFVIVGIKGAGGMVLPMQECRATFRLTDDVGGLRAGDDVRLGGFKVGTVRGLEAEFAGDEPHVVVTFALPQRYVMHKDARVAVQSTLTGQASLNIDNLGVGAPMAAGDRLAGHPGAMSVLLHQLADVAPDVVAIAHDVRTVTVPKVNDAVARFHETGAAAADFVHHLDAKVDPVVERYNGVSDKAQGALGEVRDLLGDTKGDFRGTMAHLNAATGSVKEKLPGILDQVHEILAKVDGAVAGARTALEDLQKTVANARDLTASGRSIIVGNKGKIDAMIASLRTTGENLKAASVEIRHSPWRLLYKPNPGEMANLNIYDSARQFAEGAVNVSDAAVALRDALNDPQADKGQLQKLVDHLDATFADFQQVERKLVSSVKE